MRKNILAPSIRLLSLCLIVLIICVSMYVSVILLYPFFIGLLLAYFIQPIMRFFENRLGFSRGFSAFFSIFLIFILIIAFFIFLFTQVYENIQTLFTQLPYMVSYFITTFQDFFEKYLLPTYENFLSRFEALNLNAKTEIFDTVQNFGTNFIQSFEQWLTNLLYGLFSFIQHLPSLFTTIMFSLLATFFIAKDWERIYIYLYQKLPKKTHQKGKMIAQHLQKALFGWLKAQFILLVCTGCMVFVGLLILRVEYAAMLTLFITFVDLLPFLGTGIIFLPWIFANILSGNLPFAIALLILYILIIIQRQMLEPKILSGNLGLDPLSTLISVFVGFQIFGFLGLMIGPIILVLFISLKKSEVLKDLVSYIKTGKNLY